MDDLVFYVDRLRDGKSELLDYELSPGFMTVEEEDLMFPEPVLLQGTIYLAEEELVFHGKIKTFSLQPCSVCNAQILSPLEVKDFYHVESLENIKGKVYDLGPTVRETVLLEVSPYVECGNGHCERRKELEKYLKLEDSLLAESEVGETYQPFKDLL